jgi:phosphoglycerate dehydrogenase-like enzyme
MDLKVLVSFDLPDQFIQQIQQVSPQIHVTREWDDVAMLDAIKNVDVLFAGKINRKMAQAAQQLKWIHSWGVGVDRFLTIPEISDSPIFITTSRGVAAITIAEHAMVLILLLTRKLKQFILAQNRGVWLQRPNDALIHPITELKGKTLGIIGLGTIGREIARRAKGFDMKILATKKTTTTLPPFVDELLPHTELKTLLRRSDIVVISAPLTPETKGLIGEAELKAMKPTAYLINIGRGKIIEQATLIKALKEKKIAGASLDVFEVEPLPPESELWGMENVIITPHVAGDTIHYWERTVSIFCDNLRRYLEQRPLINLADKKAGY